MALSPIQLRRLVEARLTDKHLVEIPLADVLAALNAAPPGTRSRLEKAIQRRDAGAVGTLLLSVAFGAAQAAAVAEAGTIVADNALDADEIERVFL